MSRDATSFTIPPSALKGLSTRSRECIERLRLHRRDDVDISAQPLNKLAAVLVLLYERAGDLRVLLTTRSKTLRSHPGQTALPGGKVDETDDGVLSTAYREAHEEVNLPLNSAKVHPVCILRPFVSAYKLVVTPVVALLDDLMLLDGLKASEGEVDHIFDHLLEALLDPEVSKKDKLVESGSEHWPYQEELHNTSDNQITWLGIYRMHRFRSTASPVKGLTADILIMTAEIAYDKSPMYERWHPNSLGYHAAELVLKEARETQQADGEESSGNAATSALDPAALAVVA